MNQSDLKTMRQRLHEHYNENEENPLHVISGAVALGLLLLILAFV